MNMFGKRLRQARERQGLTLPQVAMETHILPQWVAALEEGAYDRLPNDVVVKGFIRNYAQFLGLPMNDMLALYRQERGGNNGSLPVLPTTSLAAKRSYVLPSFFGVFFVTIVFVGLTYVLLSAVGRVGHSKIAAQPAYNIDSTASNVSALTDMALERQQTPSILPTEMTIATYPHIEATNQPTATRRGNAAGMAQATPTPHSTLDANAPIVADVSVLLGNGSSWMRVQADGNIIYEGIMREGENQLFQAQQRISLRAANSPAVSVSVNGMPPEILGSVPGKTVYWYWPPR